VPETEPVEQSGFGEVPAVDYQAEVVALRDIGDGYGRLATVAGWLARVLRPDTAALDDAVAVVLAADHGIAAADVDPPGASTADLLAALRLGTGPVATLAARSGVRLRIEDLGSETAGTIRAGSGRIDREDALSLVQTRAALDAGRAIADEEADRGTAIVLLGAIGAGDSVAVAAIAAVLTGAEPIAVVGRSGLDAALWMRRTSAVRDAMRRGTPHRNDPIALLQHVGGADLACAAGLLAQAAVRRTPVVIDGALGAVAGLLAAQLAPSSPQWWAAAASVAEPAQALTLAQVGIEPILDLDLAAGDALGALIALDVLRAARDLSTSSTALHRVAP
jgi:nicotinate-nucleotide--dimethylbenzimidazole phosphoribosyltransferase